MRSVRPHCTQVELWVHVSGTNQVKLQHRHAAPASVEWMDGPVLAPGGGTHVQTTHLDEWCAVDVASGAELARKIIDYAQGASGTPSAVLGAHEPDTRVA